MLELYTRLQARLASERGATAVEYGIMVALIAVVIIAAVRLLGEDISALFTDTSTELGGGTTP